MYQTIELPCYGIVVNLGIDDEGSAISSDLQVLDADMPKETDVDYEAFTAFNHMMDAVESMILGHAEAGIDVASNAYCQGIESCVQACGNQ